MVRRRKNESGLPNDLQVDEADHTSTSLIRLLTRLLFVWFIKEKQLINADLFDEEKVRELIHWQKDSSYYKAILQNLFFATLNQEIEDRGFRTVSKSSPYSNSYLVTNRYRYRDHFKASDEQPIIDLFARIPFLNGGLFECLDREATKEEQAQTHPRKENKAIRIDGFSDRVDNALHVPNELFFSNEENKPGLIDLFQQYQFTVEESTPVDQEVALDPELLGQVFENLLASYNPETGVTARKQTGSFYTPREIVNYMVDEALVALLSERCRPTDGDSEFWQDRLRYLLDYAQDFDDANELFDKNETESIVHTISELKILDPAVGSGAFPMGILHKLTLVLQRLDPENERWEKRQKEFAMQRAKTAFNTKDQEERDAELLEISENFENYSGDFGHKLYLIQNNIFGVDVQPIACQIAKLRFFISLAIEQEPDWKEKNFGIKPLPNLETKFVAANTLFNVDKPVPMSMSNPDVISKERAQMSMRNPEIYRKEAELAEVRRKHFTARTLKTKIKYREQDKQLRLCLSQLLIADGWGDENAAKIAQWEPYEQNTSAAFFDPEWMFGITQGFDMVIGNPPYISHDKIPKQYKAKIKDNYQSYQPFADVYCYFIEKAIELQNEGGVLSFITSNSYLRAEYGEPIRRFLRNRNTLLRVLSIEDSQVFESVIVNVAILVSRKPVNLINDFCIVVNLPFSGNSIEDFVESNGFKYPQVYFNSKSWSLAEPKLVQLQRKLESSGKTLEQLRTKIRLGIATGSNDAFLIDEEKKKEFCQENPVNAEIIKPILRGRDISRYSYTLSGQHILLAKNGVNVKKSYPEIYNHLDSFGDKFKNRGAKGQHWTNLRACSFYEDFKKEKIVWIELTDLGRFALCSEEVYLLNSAYFLLPPLGLDSKFLLGILNSNTIRFYLGLVAETSGMGTSRWINNYVKEFPIPLNAPEQQTSIIKHVNQILDAKNANPAVDTGKQEEEIDQLVYALYGLTTEEIEIVEEGTHLKGS